MVRKTQELTQKFKWQIEEIHFLVYFFGNNLWGKLGHLQRFFKSNTHACSQFRLGSVNTENSNLWHIFPNSAKVHQ